MSLRQEQQQRDFLAAAAARRPPPVVGIEGVVGNGSGSPTTYDATLVRGDTFAAQTPGEALAPPRIPLGTMQAGDQWTPEGDEDCVALPIQGGSVLVFLNAPSTAPNAPPPGTRTIGNLKLFKVLTRAGNSITFDDAGKAITIESVGGLKVVLDDNTGLVDLGATGLNTTQDAVVTQRYLQAAIEGLRAATQAAITQLAGEVAGGTGVGPPTVADYTTHGSSKVLAAQ
jgi:hypothetical protein